MYIKLLSTANILLIAVNQYQKL